MSETETDELARVRRTLTFVREQRNAAWDELKRQDDDLAAARAEVVRLREAVERVEGLAKVNAIEAHARMWPVVERNWLDVLAIIERIPAPVEPSGEAESDGQLIDRVTGRPATAYTPPEDVVRVAPVPSGGQADGEGEGLRDQVANALIDAWKRAEPDHAITQYPASYVATFVDLADAAIAVLAARPVLSRDAVVIRDDDEFDDKADQIDGVCWLYADGHPWVAWCTEDGDWYAIRALTEDDEPTEGYAVTPWPMEAIPYPWVLQSVTGLADVLAGARR